MAENQLSENRHSEHRHSENCKEIFALLSQYLDMELPEDACRDLEAHMQGCAPCIQFTESLRKTVALCRAYTPEELPKPLEQSARTELEAAYRKMLEARSSDSH
jgi:anti-sigma factor RsiW